MEWTSIACLEDLLRPGTFYPEAFYDWAREPIRQATGLDIGHSPRRSRQHNLHPGFDFGRFQSLVREGGGDLGWERHYLRLPAAAEEYLADHIRPGTLILAMELPPWLADLCDRRGIPFLDLRCSPLRFARDLYMAIRTNDRTLYDRLARFEVPEEECRLEAAVLAGSVRAHQQRLQITGRFDFRLGDCLIYIGQVGCDAAVIGPGGRFVRCTDHADDLRRLDRGQRLYYKPHPYAGEFAEQERSALAEIFGRNPEICMQNTYQILSADSPVELTGISSGVLQEAAYFDKKAHPMYRPFCPLRSGQSGFHPDLFQQIHFEDYLAPGFWHAVLAPDAPPPRISRLPAIQPNHFREMLDLWWDYSKVMLWERSLWIEAFERSGGGALRQRILALEERLNRTV